MAENIATSKLPNRVNSLVERVFRPFETLAQQTKEPLRLVFSDFFLAGVVGVIAGLIAIWCSAQMGRTYLEDFAADIWFDADAARVFKNLVSFSSDHYRTSVHPISALLLTPPVYALHEFGGVEQVHAAQTLIIACAASVAGLYVLTLRLMGVGIVTTLGLSALFLVSASFLHWSGTVELYVPASLTIMLPIAALAAGTRFGVMAWVVVSAASLSITVTNWMIGLAASLVRWRRGPFIAITVTALLIVMALSVVQKVTFNNAQLFFHPRGIIAENSWIQPVMEREGNKTAVRWSLVKNWRSMLFSSVVAPPPYLDFAPDGSALRVSNQELKSNTVPSLTIAATVTWGGLICLGIWGAFLPGPHRNVAAAVGMTLAGQMALHAVYGYPTFLYSAHFLPLLAMLAAFSWFTPVRRVLPALVVVIAALVATSNIPRFLEATELLNEGLAARHREMGGISEPSVGYEFRSAMLVPRI